MLFRVLLAFWAAAPMVWSQEPGPSAVQDAEAVTPLEASAADPGLTILEKSDVRGLGREAGRLKAWAAGRGGLTLRRRGLGHRLVDGRGESLALTPELGAALGNLNSYFGITAATLARPPAHEELSEALTSPAGVAGVRALFDRMISERIVYFGRVAVPEIGGEATLDSELRLRQWSEPGRPLIRSLAAACEDPEAVAKIYSGNVKAVELIDEHGQLKRIVQSWPVWVARDKPVKSERERIWKLVLTTVLENASETFIYDPAQQLEAIVGQPWSGRYIGMWHTHPPHYGAQGWMGSEEPSVQDMEVARDHGQNLTIAFQPEGFDAYDLAPLYGQEPDLSKVRKVSYRGADWKKHFDELHARLRP